MNSNDYNNRELERLREEKRLTQQAVAEAVSVDRNTIYRAEAGTSCSYKLLRRLADFYEVDIVSLVISTQPASKKPASFFATV